MMDYTTHNVNGKIIVEITDEDLIISSTSDFLDLIANLPSSAIILKKEMLDESFFDLKSGLAGEILQKLTNYFVKIAIIGDFSAYNSKSFKDFVYESNKGNCAFFLNSVDEALRRL